MASKFTAQTVTERDVGFSIDKSDERLLGPHGPVRLGNKAFQVLLRLVERRGRLVTKDELMSSVWDGTIVSEFSLTSAIKELRRGLDDDARAPRFIESVYGRGYRLLQPIGIVDIERSPAIERRWSYRPVAEARAPSFSASADAAAASLAVAGQAADTEDRTRAALSVAQPWKRLVALLAALTSLNPVLTLIDRASERPVLHAAAAPLADRVGARHALASFDRSDS